MGNTKKKHKVEENRKSIPENQKISISSLIRSLLTQQIASPKFESLLLHTRLAFLKKADFSSPEEGIKTAPSDSKDVFSIMDIPKTVYCQ